MIFMNHIISWFELREILNLLSLISSAALLLFLPPEYIRLRDNHEFQHRILISFRRIAGGSHNLTRIDLPLHVITVKTAQIIIPQILCKTLRPSPGRGQKHNPVAASLQPLQVPCQKLKTVVVRIDALCLYAVRLSDMKHAAF